MTVKILIGDARERLKELPDESIHCCVSSPPYYGLRDYGTAKWEGGDPACDHVVGEIRIGLGMAALGERYAGGGHKATEPKPMTAKGDCPHCSARRIDKQLGLEATPDAYIAEMVAVFREVRRVLRSDGTLWLNLGMSYSRGDRPNWDGDAARGTGFHAEITAAGGYGDMRPNPSRQPPRAPACDNGGTEPRCSTGLGSAYLDPDGERRAGSPSHYAHTVGSDQRPQLFEPPPEPIDRDSGHPGCAADLAEIARLAARLSTNSALPENAQDAFARAARVWDDLLHAPTSLADALECVRKAACNPDNAPLASASHSQDKDASGLACRCGSCGFCFIRLAMTALRFKPKDEINIPHLVALALQADGWYLRQTIVWHKPNPMPESVTDRCTKAHEYLFLLSKSERYHFDAAAIAEPAIYADSGRSSGSKSDFNPMRKRNGLDGNAASFRAITEMRNRRSVWTIATAPYSEAHFATFPPALVEPCILAGTSAKGVCPNCGSPWVRRTGRNEQPGAYPDQKYDTTDPLLRTKRNLGARYQAQLNANPIITTGWTPTCACPPAAPVPATVLDPFGGAGTTGLVADRLGRNAVLIELNPDYAAMARRRIADDAGMFGQVAAD